MSSFCLGAFIRAMRQALDEQLAAHGGAAEPAAVVVVKEASAPARADYGVQEEVPPTGLLRKLQAGKFVISVEVDPPRGFNAEKQIEGARHAAKVGADAVNVADSPMARVRMGALALCVLIQQQVGIETILHFTTRDRSLTGLQADLIGAHAPGDEVTVTVIRRSQGDMSQQELAVVLAANPDNESIGFLGVLVAPFFPAEAPDEP